MTTPNREEAIEAVRELRADHKRRKVSPPYDGEIVDAILALPDPARERRVRLEIRLEGEIRQLEGENERLRTLLRELAKEYQCAQGVECA